MICTASQPQLFPPLYMVARYQAVDVLIWIQNCQYKSKQFMSELHLSNGKRTRGVGMVVQRDGPNISQTRVEVSGFVGRLNAEIETAYPQAPHLSEVQSLVQMAFTGLVDGPMFQVVPTATERLMAYLGKTPRFVRELPCGDREENASKWVAGLARAEKATVYAQGLDSMRSYFEAHQFHGVALKYQNYPEVFPLSGKLSIWHSLLEYGTDKTVEFLNKNEFLPYEDTV